ncbi:hypothetical protein FGIG_00921 [Fasciola gigantica]|uniref:Uncharacterized protein n=1 Tax=Fasciola gigantica TaxID=46835 RepID=A0A504Z1V5_FASGI|nr:hypothetical protein FGIG_00921 [Fasciola gigantica]
MCRSLSVDVLFVPSTCLFEIHSRLFSEKSKAHVQMDTISSSRDALMRAIHRLKESTRWNEVDLSPNGEHFKVAFLSFRVEDTKPSSSIDLSLEDETPYIFSNMIDIKKYNFHVSSRLMKRDSVRPIPRGLLGLGSIVESKLQLTFRKNQWIEIPENSVSQIYLDQLLPHASSSRPVVTVDEELKSSFQFSQTGLVHEYFRV